MTGQVTAGVGGLWSRTEESTLATRAHSLLPRRGETLQEGEDVTQQAFGHLLALCNCHQHTVTATDSYCHTMGPCQPQKFSL